MDKQELLQFLKDNLTIQVRRDQDYYSHPHLTVTLRFDGEVIDSDQCTIYDGERSD